MDCLVTGATGFIGKVLTKRLIKEGHNVKTLIHDKQLKTYCKKVECISCDITNPSTLKSLPENIDIVFHCAALVKAYGPKDKFYNVNVEGTKNIVRACKKYDLKRFIFLSHIGYESEKKLGHYSFSKKLAEDYLIEKYRRDNFPVVIIRPGNVYGPGAVTWVLRPIEAIKKNQIALIDNGQGIMLHTYIDNLINALIAAITESDAIGQTIDITDGDYSISWRRYFHDLANMIGKQSIQRNFTKRKAMLIAKTMILLNRTINFKPWVTPLSVNILTNDKTVSIKKAEKILHYKPRIDYNEGMKNVEYWLKHEGYIN